MPTLYELKDEQAKILNELFFLADSDEFEDVEFAQYLTEKLESIHDTAAKKIDFIASIMLEAQAIAEQRREIARKAQIRAQRADKVKDGLRERILELMLTFDIKKVEGKYANITTFKSEKLVFTGNVYDLPDHLLRYREPEPKLVDIKKAIKEGQEVKGASLVKQDTLRVA